MAKEKTPTRQDYLKDKEAEEAKIAALEDDSTDTSGDTDAQDENPKMAADSDKIAPDEDNSPDATDNSNTPEEDAESDMATDADDANQDLAPNGEVLPEADPTQDLTSQDPTLDDPSSQDPTLDQSIPMPQQGQVPPMPPTMAPPSQPTAPIQPGSPGYYSDLMNRLKVAQDQTRQNQSLNDIGKYALVGAESFRGVGRNPLLEKTMDDASNRANQPLTDFTQQLQVEAEDPNSPAAQAYRSALSSTLGVSEDKLANMNPAQMDKLAGTLGKTIHNRVMGQAAYLNSLSRAQTAQNQSALIPDKQKQLQASADLSTNRSANELLKPGQFQQRLAASQAASDAKQAKSATDTDYKHDNDLVTKTLQMRGDPAIQADKKTLQRVQNSYTVMNKFPDLNKMPDNIVQMLNADLATIVQGGVPGEGLIHDIATPTMQSKISRFYQSVGNSPTGAQLGSFLKLNKSIFGSLGDDAQSRIDERSRKLANTIGISLSPVAREHYRSQYLPNDIIDKNTGMFMPKASSNLNLPPQAPGLSAPPTAPPVQSFEDWKKANGR